MAKLLKQKDVYQYIELTEEECTFLTQRPDIKPHDSNAGDFMLLANYQESLFLRACGLNLDDVWCDYYIITVEENK